MNNKIQKKITRRTRIRGSISGTSDRPRLSTYRSNIHIYAQLIDDVKGLTIVECSDIAVKDVKKKTESAYKVGENLAKKALKKGIKSVVFDRGGNMYHGRVKSLADGARKGGLIF